MIAMRQPHEFAIHMGDGLNNGLTLKEIEEVLIQALPYVGYPTIATALTAAAEVIKVCQSVRPESARLPPKQMLPQPR
jgi:4-carboxymuconolactone decarboxylase